MPTGYTAELYEGKEVSFRDFVLRCSRGMGAAVLLRDSHSSVVPTPENVNPPYSYAARRLDEARDELLRWKTMTDAEALEATRIYNEKQAQALKDALAKDARLRASYEGMLAQVKQWEPPTPEHYGLKEFMLDQILSSIKFDCRVDERWYAQMLPGDLRDRRIDNLTREVERLETDVVNDTERDAWRKAWVQALYDSLPEEAA